MLMTLDINATWPYFLASLIILRENQAVLMIFVPTPSPSLTHAEVLWIVGLDSIPHFPKWPAHEDLSPLKPTDIRCQL